MRYSFGSSVRVSHLCAWLTKGYESGPEHQKASFTPNRRLKGYTYFRTNQKNESATKNVTGGKHDSPFDRPARNSHPGTWFINGYESGPENKQRQNSLQKHRSQCLHKSTEQGKRTSQANTSAIRGRAGGGMSRCKKAAVAASAFGTDTASVK